jgi:hypothetical protein
MKRNIYTALFALLLLLTAQVTKAQNEDRIGSQMPEFSFDEIDGTKLSKTDLTPGKPVLFFYFDPDCDHCQEISRRINEKISSFDHATICFVTYSDMEVIKEFPAKHLSGAVGRKNFHFANDTQYKFDSYFGYSEAPTLHVYNSKGVKAKVFRKEVEVAEILLYLK